MKTKFFSKSIAVFFLLAILFGCKEGCKNKSSDNSYKVNDEYLKKPGLPPKPQNDCTTIVDNVERPTRYDCDGSVCRGTCHMYMLDLDNPSEWVDVPFPVTDTNARHIYVCRCVESH